MSRTLLRLTSRHIVPRIDRALIFSPTVTRLQWRFVSVPVTDANDEATDENLSLAHAAPQTKPEEESILERLRLFARFGQTFDSRYTEEWKYEECRNVLEQWKSSGDMSPEAVTLVLRVVLRCKFEPHVLSKEIQAVEKLVGSIGKTPLTDELSLQLLKTNGQAGHVGRSVSLLGLRKKRGFKAVNEEFQYAIQSIISACLDNRKHRNVFAPCNVLDNPTRFLDAILLNMHQRDFELTPHLAHKMLSTYASSPTGKAVHFHYTLKMTRDGPRVVWNQPPPYYKVPSQIKADQDVALPGSSDRKTKMEFERDKFDISAPLSFYESLVQGVCGHDPIMPTLELFNAKIKICCYRGAIWHAMDILQKAIPQAGLEPDTRSYLRILQALARLGDITTMKKLFTEMNQKDVPLNRHVVEAMVSGYLNAADIAGSITFVQDVFNQYSFLPPYNTHLNILEMALASKNPYEAKRHVYFLQQLWKFQPNDYHGESIKKQVRLTVQHPMLTKMALQELFQYFGYELNETDFLVDFRD